MLFIVWFLLWYAESFVAVLLDWRTGRKPLRRRECRCESARNIFETIFQFVLHLFFWIDRKRSSFSLLRQTIKIHFSKSSSWFHGFGRCSNLNYPRKILTISIYFCRIRIWSLLGKVIDSELKKVLLSFAVSLTMFLLLFSNGQTILISNWN